MSEHRLPVHAELEKAENDVAELVERAFQYRGDVTIRTDDGGSLTGYLFNRDARSSEPFAQLFETHTGREVSIPYRTIVQVLFTGRDTAAASVERFETFQHRQDGSGPDAGRTAPASQSS